MQVVLKLIQPYTRIRIPFVSQQLNIPEYDVEQLLVALILDSRIQGHIDQVHLRILHTPSSSRDPETERPIEALLMRYTLCSLYPESCTIHTCQWHT